MSFRRTQSGYVKLLLTANSAQYHSVKLSPVFLIDPDFSTFSQHVSPKHDEDRPILDSSE